MSVSDSSMQRKLHLGRYCRSLLHIGNNYIFDRYFVKMLVIFSSPIFYSDHIRLLQLVIPYPITFTITADFSHSFKMCLEQLTAPILMLMPPPLIEVSCMITTVSSRQMPSLYVTLM